MSSGANHVVRAGVESGAVPGAVRVDRRELRCEAWGGLEVASPPAWCPRGVIDGVNNSTVV